MDWSFNSTPVKRLYKLHAKKKYDAVEGINMGDKVFNLNINL